MATMSRQDLEAKIVVLGSQGVGKTSLLTRFIHNTFVPPSAQPPTIGATFLTKRLESPADHPSSTIRLQIWDTAGQERFRSISKLYYRGANAAILCYDITDERSFTEMGNWLHELREYNGTIDGEDECVIHVVGTKADVVAEDPRKRQVPLERCITYVAEQLHGLNTNHAGSTTVNTAQTSLSKAQQATSLSSIATTTSSNNTGAQTPHEYRSSGFWGHDTAWDSCHEISAKDGEGVEEVFRVLVRKLVDQRDRRERVKQQREAELMLSGLGTRKTPGVESMKGANAGYFAEYPGDGRGSFRLGHGDKRRSWLGFPTGAVMGVGISEADVGVGTKKGGRCC